MCLNMIFCSYWGMIQWLQNHLLACPFKVLTGYDCPGCGFQRSVIALLQGNLSESLHYYPATIPLICAVIFTIFRKKLNLGKKEYILQSLYVFTGLIITGSYALKLSGYLH